MSTIKRGLKTLQKAEFVPFIANKEVSWHTLKRIVQFCKIYNQIIKSDTNVKTSNSKMVANLKKRKEKKTVSNFLLQMIHTTTSFNIISQPWIILYNYNFITRFSNCNHLRCSSISFLTHRSRSFELWRALQIKMGRQSSNDNNIYYSAPDNLFIYSNAFWWSQLLTSANTAGLHCPESFVRHDWRNTDISRIWRRWSYWIPIP